MYKFWIFTVDTNVKFPEDVYYFKYKGLEFKYLTRYKEGKSDNIIVRYKNMPESQVYSKVAEYLNALSFARYCIANFTPIYSTTHNAKLHEIQYKTDKTRSLNANLNLSDIYFIANIENEEQSQLVSLFSQAYCNENVYFKLLFYWHVLVYPGSDDSCAVNFINDNIDKIEDYQIKFISSNPIFAKSKKIEKTLGDYIKYGIRHSIAHIIRNKSDSVSLILEDWEQIRHIATIARILEGLARFKIKSIYKVSDIADIEKLYRFEPETESY